MANIMANTMVKIIVKQLFNNEIYEKLVLNFLIFKPNTKEELKYAINNIKDYGNPNLWDVYNITDMSNLFEDNETFNYNINNWNVSNVINMSYMFYACHEFNQPLNNWNVSNVTNMKGMFFSCRELINR